MERSLYKKLVQWKKKKYRRPLILRGARQVGKTWLLTSFGNNEFANTHTINFEKQPSACSLFDGDLTPDFLLKNLELYLEQSINPQHDLIFFDEIQDCPRALTSLKYFAEELPVQAVCCAGSHIGLSMAEASFPVGSIDTLTLYPMTFREYLYAKQESLIEVLDAPPPIAQAFHNRLWDELKTYYFVGGMPEAVQSLINHGAVSHNAFESVREIQSRLILGYQADFAKHSGKINAAHINRVFNNIPEQISHTIDDSSVSRYRFKEAVPGLSKFSQLAGPIDWLIQAGLILPVYIVNFPAIPLRSRKKINTFKLFLFDIGILGAMAGLSVQNIMAQDFGTYKGFMAENYAAQELITSGFSELYSWKGKTSEIEFILDLAGKIIPVEVKSGTRISRAKSLSVYREKYKPEEEVIVSALPEKTSGKRKYLPLYKTASIPEVF